MIDFSNRKDVQDWLQDKPPAWSFVIGARATLRAVPTLRTAIRRHDNMGEVGQQIIGPVLCAAHASWLVARYPKVRNREYRAIAVSFALETPDPEGRRPVGAFDAADAASDAARTVDANGRAVAYGAADATRSAAEAFGKHTLEAYAAASSDAEALSGVAPTTLAERALWANGTPSWALAPWIFLKRKLLADDPYWDVWTQWYEQRLEGVPPSMRDELKRSKILNDYRNGGAAFQKLFVHAEATAHDNHKIRTDSRSKLLLYKEMLARARQCSEAVAAELERQKGQDRGMGDNIRLFNDEELKKIRSDARIAEEQAILPKSPEKIIEVAEGLETLSRKAWQRILEQGKSFIDSAVKAAGTETGKWIIRLPAVVLVVQSLEALSKAVNAWLRSIGLL